MLKRRLDGKTLGTLFVLLLSLCISAFAGMRSGDKDWSLDPSDYRYDMSLYFALASKDYEDLSKYEIGAFIGDECRGLAEKWDLPDNSGCLYMRVRSNSSEPQEVTFMLRDKSSGRTVILKGDEPFIFRPDACVGLPSEPYLLTCYYNVTVEAEANGTVDFASGLYPAGAVLTFKAVPNEGYNFDKWSDGNTDAERTITVTDSDIDLKASFTPAIFNAVYKIDGEVITSLEVAYGSAVPSPEAPAREGFTFAGWNDIPVTMPAHDIEVTGGYIPNSYNAVFKIDGEIIAALNLEYGAPIIAPEAPEKIGHTFNGWDNVPATMPAGHIEITGSYSVNSYYLSFNIGNERIAESTVAYGSVITAPEAPAKEGYTFTGWQNLPETMPAHDLDIYGDYQLSTYNAVFVIDGETVATVPVQFGMAVTAPEAPEKEGHTFAGWQGVPDVMPAQDVVITGSYTINSYKATFVIDGVTIATLDVEYNAPVAAPEAPAKEGYTFTGWQNVPATMPAFDVEILGTYDVVAYNAVFVIDGETVATIPVDFGSPVIAPEAPAKEGHSFVGWQNLPETMPAHDVEITGSYTINVYTATFRIDGETIATLDVEYGAPVTAPEAPAREGYAFTGWQNLPETMPAFNVEILGTYDVVAYNAVFVIDGETVANLAFDFGAPVVAPEAPAKEGHTFAGWQNVPETMPAENIEITGSYTVNTYKASFIIDGETVATLDVEYNAPVVAPEAPAKEGHAFTGWQNVPETMPAFDVEILGTYDVIAYNAVFVIDGETIATLAFDFGAPVIAPEAPAKEGHSFAGWQNVPETMPAENIEISGSYTVNTYKATFIADGETVATLDVEYNAPVVAPEAPAKEGHAFTGWQNVPETMPAFDVVILGTYDVMAYNAVFVIDGETIATVPFDFGAPVIAPEAPAKEGHSFAGRQNLPETMPANDVEITGSYTVNTYKASFTIDGELIATLDVEYNAPVVAPEAPAREGHTFTGWQNVPETMPAFDVEIVGTYSVNTYTATFKVDDEVIATIAVDYGSPVVAPEAPAREGYVFDGWVDVPGTMPAQDITIYGSYSEDPNVGPVVNTYTATFKIDGEVIAMLPVQEGAEIIAPEVPTKEGHTFSGWENIPDVMPDHDIEINGSYAVNSYKATFVIDGQVIAETEVAYNTAVAAPEAPAKEGYTFTGWQNVPETMPPFDITIEGSYAVNSYTVTFKIDGEVVATEMFDFGAPVVAPEAPVREGHTFAGWTGLPESMPAQDIEVNGAYTVNSYKATFMIDGQVIAETEVVYNTAVTAPEAPVREGYTFTGWQNVPETMPPFDITIEGSYAVNSYKATFMIDGQVIAIELFDFGAAVVAPEAPVREGHTFTGWENLPETMPAQDIEINGAYTVNNYMAIFRIDGQIIAEMEVAYNSAVTAPEAPEKEGYTFTGWQNVPETMPPFDIVIDGAYAVNTYTATFRIDGELIAALPFDFGAPVVTPEAPVIEGHTFTGWQNVPETMPAQDIEINGDYDVNSYKVTFFIDGIAMAEMTVAYGTAITAPEAPEKEGYTFTGWQNVPETMPPFDITIEGSYAVNTYTATFRIGDVIVATVPFDFGAAVVAPEAPVVEGHTFTGWQNVPETMPAHDIEISGAYDINSYKATFMIGDEVIAETVVVYNTAVTAPEAPEKEGYTFTGWQNVPETMPPFDIVIVGSYAVNTYTATFRIGDVIVATVPFDFGAPVVAPEAPVIEGHTFAGWENVPATMPAADIMIEGSYTVNTYVARFYIDGELFTEVNVEYGAAVPAVIAPERVGQSFAGWDNVPETMPAADIVINGSYVLNTYTATFMIGDEFIAALRVSYGAPIAAPDAPEKEGYSFAGWTGLPETMPAEDIVVNGSYEVNKYHLEVYVNSELYMDEWIAFGSPVVIPDPEVPEGYEFLGWDEEIPETMPAHDVTIHGATQWSGIDLIGADSDVITVYSLSGVLLYRDITIGEAKERLAPGFYIVNDTKVMIK